jgi:hypothetical protein
VLGKVTPTPNAEIAVGSVVSSNPAAGTLVDSGAAVNLEVSSGPEKVAVPDVVGLTQSDAQAKLQTAHLATGTVTQVHSAAATAGNVVSTTPAAGVPVDLGSMVNLDVSSGPAPQVKVPDVVGLTRQAAEASLKTTGLVVGALKKHHSSLLPKGGIIRTDPKAGSLVSKGLPVDLEVSQGPERSWTRYIPQIVFGAPGLLVLIVIVIVIVDPSQVFLKNLAQTEVARGLITFLIAIATVGIAIILTVSTLVLPAGEDGDKRFDRGKQVLTALIGVLGTIVGFYFASAITSTQQAKTAAIITTALPEGTIKTAYPSTIIQTAGLTPPLSWSVKPNLPAGLNLDQKTGTISGTPTETSAKTSTFKFTVIDGATPPNVMTAELALEIK